jgi:hypothetical protein
MECGEVERGRAEALAYPEATAITTARAMAKNIGVCEHRK